MPHALPLFFYACYVTASLVLFHLINQIIFDEENIIMKLLLA